MGLFSKRLDPNRKKGLLDSIANPNSNPNGGLIDRISNPNPNPNNGLLDKLFGSFNRRSASRSSAPSAPTSPVSPTREEMPPNQPPSGTSW